MYRRAGPTPLPLLTSVMRSPSTATSADLGGAPVPSTTVPPRITRSWGIGYLPDGGEHFPDEHLLGQAGLVLLGVHRRAHDDEAVDAEGGQLAHPSDAVLGRTDDAEAVDELVGQLPGLGRPGACVLVHVVAVVHVVQDALGGGVDRTADGAVHGREAGEGREPSRADATGDRHVGVDDDVDEGADAFGSRGP